jgi:DNA-binding Lrp family transcriptional regulator
MAKSSIKQIEKDEKKILNELSKNANKSINDIAKTCGFSRQKVWRVIKNLEKNLTIWGYTAIVDEEKLNKKSYMMLIKRTNKPLTKELLNQITSKEILNNFKKIGIDITNSYYINGAYDWVVCFNTTDIAAAKSFSENYNKLFEGFVSESHLMEIMFKSVCCGKINPEIKKLKDFFNV